MSSSEAPPVRKRDLAGGMKKIMRYARASVGPIGVAGAQFLLSLKLLHSLSPAEFGTFSFLLVASNLSTGLWSALFCSPLPVLMSRGDEQAREAVRKCMFAANLVSATLAFGVFFAIAFAFGLSADTALMFAGYAALALIRWVARAYAYVIDKPLQTMFSDIIYGLSLLAGIGVMSFYNTNSLIVPYAALLVSGFAALVPFGGRFFSQQFLEFRLKDIPPYFDVLKRYSAWSLLGVITTEATANAHAYILTLFAGPAAFAPIAASTLMMRPFTVATNALTEFERPQIARHIGKGEMKAVAKSLTFFRILLIAAWVATLIGGLGLVKWAPHVVFPAAYDRNMLLMGAGLWMIVALVRQARTPDSVMMQAAGEFRALAFASVISCGVSVIGVIVLLQVAGPVWSICGILVGEIAYAAWVWRQAGIYKKTTLSASVD